MRKNRKSGWYTWRWRSQSSAVCINEAASCCSSGLFADQIELFNLYDASPKAGNVSLPVAFIQQLRPPKLGHAGVLGSVSVKKESSYQMKLRMEAHTATKNEGSISGVTND